MSRVPPTASDTAITATTGWPGAPAPLGATYDGGGTNFALWSQHAQAVELCLFDDDGRESRVRLAETRHHVWHGYLPGVEPGRRYGYRVHGPWQPHRGHRFNPAKLLLDPYARAVDGSLTYDGAVFDHAHGGEDTVRDARDSAPYVPRSVVVRDEFDWSGSSRPAVEWKDTVLYELHVRGFTRCHPGVPAELRGTYAGLAHPAAIGHLLDLGVTTVELLPVHQFVSEEHLAARGLSNYWGYNSLAFFAPHGPYAAAGTGGGQVREFKAMVRALHDAGLEVVLDVVYNHTAEGDERGPTLSLRGIDNAAYYKLRHGRHYVDYTGCGNMLNVGQPQALQLLTDSLRYWVTEMGVDGFRFDLAAALARAPQHVDRLAAFFTVIGQDPVLSRVKLIAEPWDLGEGGYQVGHFPPPWAEWNDRYRDAVRDFWRGSGPGVRDLAFRLSGSSDLYENNGRLPYASVNFVTAHDGFTLHDVVSYDRKHNAANREDNRDGSDANRSWNCGVEGETDNPDVLALRGRQARNLLTTLLLSTGVPMLVAGDEMGRTQRGNNNAYCQDNETSWLDWQLDEPRARLLEFTRNLLHLRAEHPVFRRSGFFRGVPVLDGGPKDIAWFAADGSEMTDGHWFDGAVSVLGMYVGGQAIHGRGPRGEAVVDDSFLLVLNASGAPGLFGLPGQPWAARYELVLDTADDASGASGQSFPAGEALRVADRCAVLLRAQP